MASDNKHETQRPERVGVYICHCGGNISDHVDVARVAEEVQKIPGVLVAHTNMFMCSDPGQQLIQEDIKSGKVDRVVVASCAPSLHELTFRNAIKRVDMSPYLYEHANIREQVSWVHAGEKATRKAVTLVAAAVAKARNLEPLAPIRVDARRHATVIGGGVAGLRAALDLSRRGIAVTLVEKTPFLGGQVAKLDRLAPTGEAAEAVIRQLTEAALNNPQIEICTCTQVIRSEGYVGNFKLTLDRRSPEHSIQTAAAGGMAFDALAPGSYIPFAGVFPEVLPAEAREWVLETGVIVFATGFQPYAPQEGEYGYLKQPEVITLPELIRQMAEGRPSGRRLAVGGREIRRVAFIHCVGSRQIPGIHEPGPDGQLNEYCSRTCCSAILQAAVRIRETCPETQVFEYYRDIRTYGRGQEEFYDRAAKANVIFFRYEPEAPPAVERAGGKDFPLRIRVNDTLTFGEELTAEVDLVVLAVGMEPSPIADLVEALKLPVGVDRFLQEVHPKLRPVEVANTGILLAGTCQAPMDVGEACAAAQAAAAKGTSLLVKGYVELDPFVAEVRAELCTGHGVCAGVCPIEGAITLTAAADQGRKARVNPALCTGCGICVPECPQKAIEVKGWTLKQYEEMVDAIVAV
jgi:heterodisulfide reductase subunit A2